ncbi:hypothetical protein [Phytohabitans suffuscus]|uniref:Uncharacterized protein n=1 Tax=Phytohabitans suffuscus TaxID=624315 RepID=A0A6F8YWZ4_9ACTN|nr:hypothetical protein [Phytohabitans suffuscus]BCB90695.1 hypothetical protein Psuf_080080 [Phytohabitans suffuscus]
MGVGESEPDDDGEVEAAFPMRLGPPNKGRHREPAPKEHGLGRRGSTAARHRGRPGNGRA